METAHGFRVVDDAPPASSFSYQPRFVLEDFDTITPGPISWRVKGLWPRVGVCFLVGPSMSGKTFWALDATTRVCRALPVLGYRSVAAGVVYIGAEDPSGIRLRIQGLRQDIGHLGPDWFKFIGRGPDLTDAADVAELRERIEKARSMMVARGIVPGIVVIDTMSAATPGADENGSKDLGPVLKALQDVAIDLQLLVLMVAHTGKDAERGIRGWSGQFANADGVIMLEDPLGCTVRPGVVQKVKNGPSGKRFAFSLRVIDLGHDDDGDAITTCVIEEEEPPEPKTSGRTPVKATASGNAIMVAFGRLYDLNPLPIIAPGANGAKGVLVSELRSKSYDLGLGPSEPDFAERDDEGARKVAKRKWQDQRKADFDRGLKQLQEAKRLRVENGKAWEPAKRSGS